jgi:hypothetical protein
MLPEKFKVVEINDCKEKIEQVEMERDKIRLEFENYKEATQEVGNLLEKAEENSSLRAELECARKVCTKILEYQAKNLNLNLKK